MWDDGTAIDAKVQLAECAGGGCTGHRGAAGEGAGDGHDRRERACGGDAADAAWRGSVSLVNGVAYGEPYESVNVDLTAQGQDIEASRVALRLHGMAINGNGGYDLGSKHVHGHIEGDNLQLSKFTTVQNAKVNADGVLDDCRGCEWNTLNSRT